MSSKTSKIKPTSTRKELAKRYGISYGTLATWLAKIEGLNLDPRKRILTPKQLKIIYEQWGEPTLTNNIS